MTSAVGSPGHIALRVDRSDERPATRNAQLAFIITALATTAILSISGVLPAAVLTTMGISLAITGILLVIATITKHVKNHFSKAPPPEKESEYQKELRQDGPFMNCVVAPVTEEVLFRGLLQGGLQFVLKYALPAISIAVVGVPFSLASIVANGVASVVFGASHLSNKHKAAGEQAIYATLNGIVFGSLCSVYGIWASCLAHILNNTIAISSAGI